MNWKAVIDKLRGDADALTLFDEAIEGEAVTVKTLRSIADALEAGQGPMSTEQILNSRPY